MDRSAEQKAGEVKIPCPTCRGTGCLHGNGETCTFCGGAGTAYAYPTALQAEVTRLTEVADRLAATVLLLAHDAHPTYGNTAGWRGGIGGAAMTTGCSIIDPPPGSDWTQFDLPTAPVRAWLSEHAFDIDAVKDELKAEWLESLKPVVKREAGKGGTWRLLSPGPRARFALACTQSRWP
jgi:hypothetical protein